MKKAKSKTTKKDNYELDPEEKKIENAIGRGELRPMPPAEAAKMKKLLQAAARNTMKKDQRINIRLSSADLKEIKARAAREGMPYQTMIASILHKVATGVIDFRG